MIPKSKYYKLVHCGVVIAEGSRSEMKKALKRLKQETFSSGSFVGPEAFPFVGMGSPESTIGQRWN